MMHNTNWPYPIVYLKPGKEDILSKRHPWVYSGALSESPSSPVVRLANASGQILAVGTASSVSPIAVRIFRWTDEPLDSDFFMSRFEQALVLRRMMGFDSQDIGYRLIFGEGDLLPGLVVDRYGMALVIQVGTLGLEALRHTWLPLLLNLGKNMGINVFVERSHGGRKEEGLNIEKRIIKGSLAGPITICEGNALVSVDLLGGQKTGIFLDQREHRLTLGRLSSGCNVLNVFGYTGGFSVHAGLGGASVVTTLDISKSALEQAGRDWLLNGLNPSDHIQLQGDAFELMRNLKPKSYDRVVIDPPAFAKHHRDTSKAFKAYKDVFRLGAKATSPGGVIGCFSCSEHLNRSRFQEAVWTAMLEAGREAQVLAHLGQPMDHPYVLNHPEGSYLKGLWLRVL
jgi:23S rRNA (cytosine1962-C5)-methyltransferase